MRYKSRQPHSERPLSCEELEARRCLSVTFSPRQIISDEVDNPVSVYAADLDGDGDMDVLSASSRDRKIAWYENTDGQGSFGPQIVISSRVGRVWSMIAADVDGDRDVDVLMSSFSAIRRLTDNEVVISNSIIAWYENMDGKGAFGKENVITRRGGAVVSVQAADVDGDGDVDVLSPFMDSIAWFENADGKGSFGEPKIISRTVSGHSLDAADMDGDGDVDVLATSYGQKIGWFEHLDGKGTFGDENVITREVHGPGDVQAADVDGDGDMDILSFSGNKYAWYENTDGTGSLAPENVITELAQAVVPRGGLYAADLDGDGDVDLLGNHRIDDIIVWFENTDGMGDFGPQNVLDEGREIHQPTEVRAADVDGDGDMDVLSASSGGDHIAWYENLQITAGDANRDFQFDQLDIVQVLQAAKYLTGEPATFEEGDWNGDGLFDQLDIVAALQTGRYLQGLEAAHRDN